MTDILFLQQCRLLIHVAFIKAAALAVRAHRNICIIMQEAFAEVHVKILLISRRIFPAQISSK